MASLLFEELLRSRGLADPAVREAFLAPSYEGLKHDPYLLPDMEPAVQRILKAIKSGELVYIYGDYDIDGLTATTVLLDTFKAHGIRTEAFIPNRFVEGYGLAKSAIKQIAEKGASLIVTVDCGSLSHAEIEHANELGVDVIVTDHHSVAETMPAAIATINPKRPDHKYPFIDLAGVGVAFKLAQALQQKTNAMPLGHEKWLLDLVAFGTVCDVVTLVDENRANVYWGLQVMRKTRRPGIRALTAVAGLKLEELNARSLGFVLGPHLNAAGRLETAQLSLDLLTTDDPMRALEIAYKLHDMNIARRTEQDRIVRQAITQAEQFAHHPVLVLSDKSWSHGIIGIVAAKMLERYGKPAFILQELGEESKGSARSYGDFSAVEGIRAVEQWLTRGGGHKLAAGVTLPTENISAFREAINEFYHSLKLEDQLHYLMPVADAEVADFTNLTNNLMAELKLLEPYGNGNSVPIFHIPRATVVERRVMGKEGQHLKLKVRDDNNKSFAVVGFNVADKVTADVGHKISLWMELLENEWRGRVTVEGRLLRVEILD
jgi:single-stranded-DNA-specific exonuclease